MSTETVADAALDAPARTGVLATLGWACYLGAAWTWVIGMFFPVLLVRDFGVAGWWAFAIPNVIGAAAVGFVWKNAAASRAFVDRHRAATAAFSLATLAFHALVVAAWVPGVFGVGFVVAAAVGAAVVAAASERTPGAIALGVAATAVAMVAMTDTASHVLGDWDRPWVAASPPPAALLLTAPGIAIGFLLCPHLDLTLHRARQATSPAAGKVAFAVGFGVVFAGMIAFSLLYAPRLVPMLFPDGPGPVLHEHVRLAVGVHVAVQVAVTAGLHLRELRRVGGGGGVGAGVAVLAAGAALGVLATSDATSRGWPADVTTAEAAYRGMILLYAIPFPVAVLLLASPLGRGLPPRWRSGLTWAACLAGAPFAVAGFIGGEPRWNLGVYAAVGIAVAIAALSRFFPQRREPAAHRRAPSATRTPEPHP